MENETDRKANLRSANKTRERVRDEPHVVWKAGNCQNIILPTMTWLQVRTDQGLEFQVLSNSLARN